MGHRLTRILTDDRESKVPNLSAKIAFIRA